MFTSKNEYINTNEIIYARHIKKLKSGYDRRAYPEYSFFMSNGGYIAVEKIDLKIPEFYKVEDDTHNHPCVVMGYPKDSEITYYIDLTKIVSAYIESDYYLTAGNLRVNFSTEYHLNIYKKDQYDALLEVLKNY